MSQVVTKIYNKATRIDLTLNRVTFLDNRGYYAETGEFYPSVTTVLSSYPKGYGYYEWLKTNGHEADDIMEEAGRRGTTVHQLTEYYDNGIEVSLLSEDGYPSFKMGDWSMFERYIEMRERFPFTIIENELNLVSHKYKIGGTLDRIIEMNGKKYLIDIKTSNNIWKQYWIQLSAYKAMYEEIREEKIDGVAIFWLNAKTRTNGKAGSLQGAGYQILLEDDPAIIDKYFKLFQATQTLWFEENGDITPREHTYKLSHKP